MTTVQVTKTIKLNETKIRELLNLPKTAKVSFTGDYDSQRDGTIPGCVIITWEEHESLNKSYGNLSYGGQDR